MNADDLNDFFFLLNLRKYNPEYETHPIVGKEIDARLTTGHKQKHLLHLRLLLKENNNIPHNEKISS